MGGGAPFDQSQVGHGGSAPLSGRGRLLSTGEAVCAGAVTGAGMRSSKMVAPDAGAPTDTMMRMFELPRVLLIVPATVTVNESRPS
jgi:hypothetical protein